MERGGEAQRYDSNIDRCGARGRANDATDCGEDDDIEYGVDPYNFDGEHAPIACLFRTWCTTIANDTRQTITTIIYHLAAEPEKYIPPLRAEILEHMVDGKVDKLALGKMAKLDSFMRECGRVEPLGISE